MKWLIIALVAALALFFLWPAQPGSSLHAVRGKIARQGGSILDSSDSSSKSDEEKNELLSSKKEELKAYEDALQKIEEDIARMQSEVGTCPITGEPNEFRLEKDPRPDIQAKIDKLKEEIRQLEEG